jgi:hypothetical protein
MSEDASKTFSFAGLFARIRALATTAITWLMALAVVLPFVATQVTDEVALQWIARVTIWIGSAILVLRRIVELPAEQRGILVNPPLSFEVPEERVAPEPEDV